MRSLDFKPHVLEQYAHLAAGDLALIDGAEIEVASLIIGIRGSLAAIVGMEEEELQLRTDEEAIAQSLGMAQHALQYVAGTALKGLAVGRVHIADEPCDIALLIPGQDAEGIRVWMQAHIALFDAGESLNGRAIELALICKCAVQLADSNHHTLHRSEDIGELQADKADVILLHHAPDILRCVLCHCVFLLMPSNHTFLPEPYIKQKGREASC